MIFSNPQRESRTMKIMPSLLALGASALISMGAWAQADVSLWRIDCGTGAKPTSGQRALLGHFRVSRAEPDLHVQLLPDQARRRVHGVGHRLHAGDEPERAEDQPRRLPGAGEGEARAGEVRRHQPLPRRPYRPARAVHQRHAADRQGRLGRRHRQPAGGGRERCRLQAVDRREPQGRAADRRQGRVRRRQRGRPAHAGPHARSQRACWSD